MRRCAALLLSPVLLVTLGGCDTLKARHLANQGVGLYKQGDLTGAAAKFDAAAMLDGRIPAVFLNQGFTYLALHSASPKSKAGHQAGGLAVRAFQRYIDLVPHDPRGRSYLVQTFVDTNRYEDAVAYFESEPGGAGAGRSPSLDGVTTLGLIAAKTGRIEEALGWYERRVATAPDDPDGHYSLGVLIWEHLHHHPEVTGAPRLELADRGLASLRRVVELRPHAFEGYTYINLFYRERALGQADEQDKAADLAEAERFLKISQEKLKIQPAGARAATGAK